MERLETGKDKIKKICDILKHETLEPAKKEAQQIIEAAEKEAHQIIRDAEIKSEQILSEAKAKIERKNALFHHSLLQAHQQSLETLREEISNNFFNHELDDWLQKNIVDPELGAKLINVLIKAIEQEGMSVDFSAIVPTKIPAEKINAILGRSILEKLRENSVVVGDFIGGVQIKLHDRNLTLDLSDEALKELIGGYIRKDFRDILFGS